MFKEQHSTKCLHETCNKQKYPFIGVLIKRCSENLRQIYRRTLMPKCGFNKVAKHLQNTLEGCLWTKHTENEIVLWFQINSITTSEKFRLNYFRCPKQYYCNCDVNLSYSEFTLPLLTVICYNKCLPREVATTRNLKQAFNKRIYCFVHEFDKRDYVLSRMLESSTYSWFYK